MLHRSFNWRSDRSLQSPQFPDSDLSRPVLPLLVWCGVSLGYSSFLTEQTQAGGLALIRLVSHKAPEWMPGPAGNVGLPPLNGIEGLILGLQPIYPLIQRSFIHKQDCMVIAL